MTETYVFERMKTASFISSKAQVNCPVNSLIFNDGHGLSASGNWSIQNYEISNSDNTTFSTGAGPANRHLPTGTDMLSVLETPTNSQGYQIKLPVGTTLTLDSDYNYFVVLYSTEEFTTANLDTHSKKIHVAKITEQIKFDDSNDGIEFTPKRTSNIEKGTKFAIYKGRVKTDTTIAAVSYGLVSNDSQGDWAFSKRTIIARPYFYFYEDNLKINNQLDYDNKYTLLRLQYNSSTTDSSQSFFTTKQNSGGRVIDKSPFTYTVKLVDNLKNADTDIQVGVANASLIDGSSHLNNSTYTPSHDSGWNDIHKNMYRSRTDNTVNLDGPKRYIEYVFSNNINNAVPYVVDLSIINSVSKTGSYGEVKVADTSKIFNQKIKEYDNFVVRQNLFSQEFENDFRAEMPGLARSAGQNILITNLDKNTSLVYTSSNIIMSSNSTSHSIIRIRDYYYKLSSSGIGNTVLDTTNDYYFATLNVSYYRHINDKFWSAIGSGTIPDSFTDVTWFREDYGPFTDNLKVNFNLDSNQFGLNNIIFRGGHFSGLSFNLNSVSENNKTLEISSLPSSIYDITTGGPINYSIPLLKYFTGSIILDKVIFDGSVEFLENNVNSIGQYIYSIKGRDDIHKLLGPIVNKNYLHAEDFVYSTESPIQDIADTNVQLRSSSSGSASGIFIGDTSATVVADPSSVVSSWSYGKKLYTSDGRFIAMVRGVIGSTVNFEEPARCYYPHSFDIFSNTTDYVISGLGLNTEIGATTSPRNISGTSSKGIVFTYGKTLTAYGTSELLSKLQKEQDSNTNGYAINSVKDINGDNPFRFKLAEEPNTGGNTLYNIHTVSALTNYSLVSVTGEENEIKTLTIAPNSPFVLGRIDDGSLDTRYTNNQGLYLLNKQSLTEGGLINKVDNKAHLSSLGGSKYAISIDKTENMIYGSPLYKYQDLSYTSSLYYLKPIAFETDPYNSGKRFVNKNYADIKGAGIYYAPSFKFKEGILSDTPVIYPAQAEYHSILTNALKSALSGGTETMLLGTPESRGTVSALGSNFSDFTYYDGSKVGTYPYAYGLTYTYNTNHAVGSQYSLNAAGTRDTITKLAQSTNNATLLFGGQYSQEYGTAQGYSNLYYDAANAKRMFEVFDPKSVHYHIFAPCDIFNDSMNNRNHISYSNHFEFKDFGVFAIKDADPVAKQISHKNYEGSSISGENDNKKYIASSILSSNISPSEMKRFALGRLIEVAFDFHFNMFDPENVSDKKIFYGNTEAHRQYIKNRMPTKTPITLSSNLSVGDTKVYVSRADWFNSRVTFYSTLSARSGRKDIIFNESGKLIGIINEVRQGAGITGRELTITTNTSDGTNGGHAGVATTSSGDGTGMTVNVTINSGVVTDVDVVAAGSNYLVGDTITISKSLIGGNTDVVCTLQSADLETCLTLLDTGATERFHYDDRSKICGPLNLSGSQSGSDTTGTSGQNLYAYRIISDGNDDNARDTHYQNIQHEFTLGHWLNDTIPITTNYTNDESRFRDNRYMQLHFNTKQIRHTPYQYEEFNIQNPNTDGQSGDFSLNLFGERGSTWGKRSHSAFAATNLYTYKRTYTGQAFETGSYFLGDNSHTNLYSFFKNQGNTFPKMYLPFVFEGKQLRNVTLLNQAFGLKRGRLLTPFHDSYLYEKDAGVSGANNYVNDFLTDISGEFLSVGTSNGAMANNTTTLTMDGGHSIVVGNVIYRLISASNPVKIGRVTNVSTNTITIASASGFTIPDGTTIHALKNALIHYYHPSRLFQYIQTNNNGLTKYGLKAPINTVNIGLINDGGIFASGSFTLLKQSPVTNMDDNPCDAGTSFSQRFGTIFSLSCGTTNTNTNVTTSSTANLKVGMNVYNPSPYSDVIDEDVTITAIVDSTNFTISSGANDTGTHNIQFAKTIIFKSDHLWPSNGNLVSGDDYSGTKFNLSGSYYQSDVWADRILTEGTHRTNDSTYINTNWGFPIFHTTAEFCPNSYNSSYVRLNGSLGPRDNVVAGLWAWKPQLIMNTTGVGVSVSGTGENVISTADYNRIDDTDIRKLTVDFSTAGLLNTWLNFAPNLTGYYLVSNVSAGQDAPSVNEMLYGITNDFSNSIAGFALGGGHEYFQPSYIHKIVKHEITYSSGGEMIHNIWFDNASSYSSDMTGYRVMKWAENCTYDYSPKELPLYSLSNKTSKKPFDNELYTTVPRINVGNSGSEIEVDTDDNSQQVKINVGNTKRGVDNDGTTGTNEGILSMYVIVDAEPTAAYPLVRSISEFIGSGKKLQEGTDYSFYVNDSETKYLTTLTPKLQIGTQLDSFPSLLLSEMKGTKGLVSFGETFTIEVPSYFKTKDVNKLKIGSMYNIGETSEDIINDLLESNNITYTKKSLTKKYYMTPNFSGIDLYNALLYTANFQNQEPIAYNKNIKIRDKNDSDDILDITIKEGISDVVITNNNESMFDIFNQITVYGDGFKVTKKDYKSIKKIGVKALEETDKNLKTFYDCEIRASQLLQLHSANNIQIEMRCGNTDIEYIEVGKIITVDYPSENIPVGQYMVIGIEHELGMPPNYILGKYSTGLDYKIAEVINANKMVSSQIRGGEFKETIEVTEYFSDINIRELEIEISVKDAPALVFGFVKQFGFTNKFGFDEQTASTTLYKKDLQGD